MSDPEHRELILHPQPTRTERIIPQTEGDLYVSIHLALNARRFPSPSFSSEPLLGISPQTGELVSCDSRGEEIGSEFRRFLIEEGSFPEFETIVSLAASMDTSLRPKIRNNQKRQAAVFKAIDMAAEVLKRERDRREKTIGTETD